MHPNKKNFVDGVELVFQRWTAFRLAIDMEWGGHDSVCKEAEFKAALVQYFEEGL